MTQEGLEEIFAQYVQTIEAFRPIKNSFQYEDELFEDEDDGQGDDLWVAAEEEEQAQVGEVPTTTTTTVIENKTSSVESIFSQPNATLSNESVEFPIRSPSPLSEKPLPANPVMNDDTAKQARRKSGYRLSWTSDTGLTSSVVSQNLANEIMSLFDMDFAIDIKVDTAPKLPELPFKPRRRSQQRQSQDMLTSLIPEFEKIAMENSSFQQQQQQPQQQQPKPKLIIRSVPQRSSSLKHRQELLQEMASPISPPMTPDSPVDHNKSISKKKSLLRLASLMTTVKKHHLPQSPEPSPVIQQHNTTYFNDTTNHTTTTTNTPRKTSTSTVDSTTSSSWSFVSDEYNKSGSSSPQKPLPKPPNSPDLLPLATEERISTSSTRRTATKKKRKSVMEKTMSKRKSNLALKGMYDTSVPFDARIEKNSKEGLSRSKSAFIKIGNGLKSKKTTAKQIRRISSAKDMTQSQGLYSGEHYHTTNELHTTPSEESVSHAGGGSFVKRMASFNWRIKSRKAVETS